MVTLADAYAFCERLARDHYENFPVASWLLPAPMRPHIAAIYAFARTADDFADEGDRPSAERLRLLDDWLGQLHAAIGIRDPGSGIREDVSRASRDASSQADPLHETSATAVQHPGSRTRLTDPGGSSAPPAALEHPIAGAHAEQHPGPGSRVPDPHCPPDPVFVALAETIRVHALPVSLFDDLISAFRQDVVVKRYETWEDVLDYCRRSANPVGRLVLRVAGVATDEADRASDAVCTALQLTNFWQDLARDWDKGRLYVPRADRDRFGAREDDLDGRRLTPAWRQVLVEMGARTDALFGDGRSVCDLVPGRLRWELRFTWLGGRRILDRLGAAGFDVFASRPALGPADVPSLVWHAVNWR